MPEKKDEVVDTRQNEDGSEKAKYVLRLFVAGTSRRSLRALQNLKKILEEELEGQYALEVIDIYQQPIFAKEGQIVAAPTLIKQLPPPLRKLVGDLSDTGKVLAGLSISPRE